MPEPDVRTRALVVEDDPNIVELLSARLPGGLGGVVSGQAAVVTRSVEVVDLAPPPSYVSAPTV